MRTSGESRRRLEAHRGRRRRQHSRDLVAVVATATAMTRVLVVGAVVEYNSRHGWVMMAIDFGEKLLLSLNLRKSCLGI